jgi:hypothetical protein
MNDFEFLTRDQVHEILRPIVRDSLSPDGFEEMGTLKWVRSVDVPIRQMFTFSQWKGGVVAPTWGVSLDFVPHLSGRKLQWHRTPKSAALDLVVDSRDRSLDLPYHKGQQPFKNLAPQVVPAAVLRARDFWDRSKQIADLPNAISWLRSYLSSGGLGFYNYVQHPLTLAFVYSMEGRSADAQIELGRFLHQHDVSDETKDKLHRLVEGAGTLRAH